MGRLSIITLVAAVTGTLMMVGCSQSATPAAPTQAPVKKVDYPTSGKPITLLVPWAAGTGADIGARMVAPMVEKELGVPVEVLNKGGAGSQVGHTEFANAKPDGYTILATNLPTVFGTYLDPERQAIYSRKNFLPLALHVDDPSIVAVAADGPYKTMKDLIDAAKTNPETIKAATTGIMSHDHLNALQWEQMTGVKFAMVHFDGGPAALTALAGHHVDAFFGNVGTAASMMKAGQVRVLGLADKDESSLAPGVKTFEAQGYKMFFSSSRGFAVSPETPKEIVDILDRTFGKVIEGDEQKRQAAAAGLSLRYMNPAKFAAFWDEREAIVKPLIPLAKR